MASTLGKRKRSAPLESRKDESDGGGPADLHALLQRHFEARFKPLVTASLARQKAGTGTDTDSDGDGDDDRGEETVTDSSESEWGGVSEGEDDDGTLLSPFPRTQANQTHRK